MTVTVRFGIFRYVVGSCLTLGSPMESSTPGGMEMGVRPSLDCGWFVAEKGRRAVVVVFAFAWKAGTRKLGNKTVDDEGFKALLRAGARLGASMLGVNWRGHTEEPELQDASRPKMKFEGSNWTRSFFNA